MKNKKAFTLAEILIVLAIIAVLVAIAIPIFGTHLEKGREATDLANVRSAYAELMNYAMTEDSPPSGSSVKKDNMDYSVEIPLKQTKKDWQTTGMLEVGSVKSTSPDLNQYWLNIPEKGGVCLISYRLGSNKPVINWGGSFYDYVSFIKGASIAKNSKSNCLNSTGTHSATIKDILGKILDDKTIKDIKTWAAVRNPSDGSDPNAYNYILSTIDIKGLAENSKVPVMYCDKNGKYSVGYATVKKAPDNNGSYNVLTVSSNGKYPMIPTGNQSLYDPDYKADSLISDKVDYSSGAAAQAAYYKLLAEYNKNH